MTKIDGYDVVGDHGDAQTGLSAQAQRCRSRCSKSKARSGSTKPSINGCGSRPKPRVRFPTGLFLARLNAGAKLLFEQTRINNDVWLPKYEHVSGSGRLGLVKKIALEQDLTWSNYRKFQVESKVVATQ